ncbi:MAG: iron-sulfur cluster biosynthesis transcriptional regulator SufR [Cyanobacteria bacterium J055]|nr:MAG: iron-sulfur cluster biosynthesis transcriptional regulator SufR [Cyanobacteria bacterium J055]
MATTGHPSTKDDILQHLLKQGRSTAQDLSDSLDISPQAIRRHLKDLETEGLIAQRSIQAGMGRPQHIYELTPAGRDRFPHHYDEFAVSLLDTLAETVGADRVGTILRKQWERKAMEYRDLLGSGSIAERVAKLVELRRGEGYMAELIELEPESDGESSRFVIAEYNCAISSVAESFPSVCGHELTMFTIALPDCQVERTHWSIDGDNRCGYLIRAK